MVDLNRKVNYQVSIKGSDSTGVFNTLAEACAWVAENCHFIEVNIRPVNSDVVPLSPHRRGPRADDENPGDD